MASVNQDNPGALAFARFLQIETAQ